jgi:hypothetical protein
VDQAWFVALVLDNNSVASDEPRQRSVEARLDLAPDALQPAGPRIQPLGPGHENGALDLYYFVERLPDDAWIGNPWIGDVAAAPG